MFEELTEISLHSFNTLALKSENCSLLKTINFIIYTAFSFNIKSIAKSSLDFTDPASIYLFKFSNRNTKKRC